MATIIHMHNVPGDITKRALDAPLECEMPDGSIDQIPVNFVWDGSSTPTLPLCQFLIPRHDHPVDSCKHDWRCAKAKNKEERAWADNQYRVGILRTPAKNRKQKAWLGVQSVAGFVGVKIGAFFGIGNNF